MTSTGEDAGTGGAGGEGTGGGSGGAGGSGGSGGAGGGMCVPRVCADLMATCGTPDDGCGTPLSCGTCSGTETCGGRGLPGRCGTPPGTVDSAFGQMGRAYVNFTGCAMTVAELDRGLVGAYSDATQHLFVAGQACNQSWAIAKLDARTGAPVTAFGTQGKAVFDTAGPSKVLQEVVGLALTSDGSKVVLAGSVFNPMTRVNGFAVGRLAASDGTSDANFGTLGRAFANFPNGDAFPTRMALLPNGKVLVAGSARGMSGGSEVALARFDDQGLDMTFGTGGMASIDITSLSTTVRSLKVLSDGKVLVAGELGASGITSGFIIRVDAGGALDTTFGTNGKVTFLYGTGTADTYFPQLQVQADGRILALMSTKEGGSLDPALVMFTAAGVVETQFATSGKVTIATGTGIEDAVGFDSDPNGGAILAWDQRDAANMNASFGVGAVKNDFTLDTRFGTGGKTNITVGTGTGRFHSLSSMVAASDAVFLIGTALQPRMTEGTDDTDLVVVRVVR